MTMIHNDIDAALYDEDWSDPAILVCAMLMAHIPMECGVFDMPTGKIRKFFRNIFEAHEIDAAIQELQTVGVIKLYDENRTVWVINKFKRSKWRYTTSNQIGALFHIRDHHRFALADFAAYYGLMDMLESSAKELSGYSVVPKPQLSTSKKELSTSSGRKKKNSVPSKPVLSRTDIDIDDNTKIPPTPQTGDSSAGAEPLALSDGKPEKRKPTKVKPVAVIPPLATLEEAVDAEAFDGYLLWRDECCRSNKSGEMADTKLARLLSDVLKAADKESLTGEALGYGFNQAAGAGAPNANYVLKAARGYRGKRSGGGSNGFPMNHSEGVPLPPGFTLDQVTGGSR